MAFRNNLVTTLLLLTLHGTAAAERGVLLFENDSAHAIKIVAPGITLILPAGSKEKAISTANNDSVGVHLNIWWKNDPLQLCQIYTPWSRHVLVSGKQAIVCRSNNLL
ncbi:MAG: hypothetical protein FHK82_11770 [Sedimenticola thiotaurini]|uniref:Uncharacterized protein n=1 Tax=Sedimenticola thiotaurini TaxID=1543721 RepID=A0A558CXM0_9GAMM|nr:MAG: hypothetical protein FHK82_11770 [Sedimenticola thiotaurini]